MRVNRQLTFLFFAFVSFCLFFYAVSDILLPFVLGILVAYLMDPIVDRLEARKIHRGFASALILILFFSIIIALGFVLIPLIFQQFEGFMSNAPEYVRQFNREVMPAIRARLEHISPELASQINDKAREIPSNITAAVGSSFDRIFESSLWLLNIISLILITPIVSFYLLRDWDISLAKLYSLLPQNYAPVIKKQARKVDDTISAFLRGQLTICLMLGFIYGIMLTVFGLNFGFIIGLATGLLTFIPYIGTFVGAFIGMMLAFLQFGDDHTRILAIFAIFVIGHTVESNLITPRIMGNRISVHPAWLIFGLLAGGSLLGTLGVIISVPMTAIIAVLLRFAIDQYEHSTYYLRNRNTEQLQEPTNYRGEPGSILKIDNPSTLPKKRKSTRDRKRHIVAKRYKKKPVA